jgi:hypothetical protein
MGVYTWIDTWNLRGGQHENRLFPGNSAGPNSEEKSAQVSATAKVLFGGP